MARVAAVGGISFYCGYRLNEWRMILVDEMLNIERHSTSCRRPRDCMIVQARAKYYKTVVGVFTLTKIVEDPHVP